MFLISGYFNQRTLKLSYLAQLGRSWHNEYMMPNSVSSFGILKKMFKTFMEIFHGNIVCDLPNYLLQIIFHLQDCTELPSDSCRMIVILSRN